MPHLTQHTERFINSEGTYMQRTVLVITILLFGVLTAAAISEGGLAGIIDWHVKSYGGGQVFADLVIALSLAIVWMWNNAKACGRNVWPWIVLTLLTGSFGPLLYLLTARKNTTDTQAASKSTFVG